ncbi:helix-turn-helix transcriptional regulator [Corynebacterium sp. zg-331]|uniref:ArsR/SmtB family transcription factor n=1 Tax=unclassified Corynebacterium TaxID=2624378 RepID=UPI00128C64D5|nr:MULTISPECIES: metalloregulator ArsR/SmtB family transcription factor [unclassified Corynebacterium]MBC3185130.1 helix-turn-helix transcriptional regulator [Corynebacterium sp. zg-331]MPV51628.1 metalloregulator ArsR/SmtB family transcription factor [Corynebacterium sp. zg331]
MPGHPEEPYALLARSAAASAVISAIDSEIRLSILALLVERECMVSEIVTQLHRPQPLISQHLRVLKNAGIVISHPRGRSRCYTLSSPELHDIFRSIITLASQAHAHLSAPITEIDIAREATGPSAGDSAPLPTAPM